MPEPVAPPGPARAPGGTSRRGQLAREIRAIAGLEALDGLRSRRQLVVRALTPIVLFACIMAITLQLRGADTKTHPDDYRIAVQGDYEGATGTLELIDTNQRLTFYPASDAKVAAITDADAGIAVPDHLDETLNTRYDVEVPIEVYEVTVNPPSRAAAVLVRSGFVELQKRRVRWRIQQETGAAAEQRGLFAPEVTNVERTEAGTRNITAQVIPGLICLQAALLVTGTANRLVSRRTRGLLLAQLLLPVSRRSLAFSKGLGELGIGTLTALPVSLAILAFGALTATQGGSAATILVGALATVVTMGALFALTTALGVWVGTGARTQEQVSLATGGAVIMATLVAATVALTDAARPLWLNAVPFVGSVSALRDILEGKGTPGAFLVATISTLLGALALTALAGRSLDGERMVLRNG